MEVEGGRPGESIWSYKTAQGAAAGAKEPQVEKATPGTWSKSSVNPAVTAALDLDPDVGVSVSKLVVTLLKM